MAALRRCELWWCLLWLLGGSSAWADESWYVAPTGNDSAAGSLEAPFASLPRAQSAAAAGDIVYIRGGTYRLNAEQIADRRGIFARVVVLNKSGSEDAPITYQAFENERPVFDFSDVKPARQRVSAFYVSGSWLRLSGIEITGVQVTIQGHTQSICIESQGSHNRFERLAMHDGQAIGIYHVRGAHNLFLNCDAWNNWDFTSEDGRGGNVDGFGCHPTRGSVDNVFRGCRAWYNSDDGFDCISAQEAVVFENCWALYNGQTADGKKLADGNGFKAGGYGSTPARNLPREIPRHVVRQCVAVGNKNSGFYANHHPGGCDWFSNTAYRNGANFNMLGRLADNVTDVDGYGHVLKNNLSFRSRIDLGRIDGDKCTLAGNSWELKDSLAKESFQSLDEKELFAERQPDGSLPEIKFLRPAKDSPLVDGGVKTDRPFSGTAPDIGALEFLPQ